ncbi:hypothetical protein R1flu_021662 [Riccia fluitans]|uniref:Uncharacterized protein n=1 Tax=Riccia fluitans TaxID=41844 RepID=A0ABD1ZQ14_9MARC
MAEQVADQVVEQVAGQVGEQVAGRNTNQSVLGRARQRLREVGRTIWRSKYSLFIAASPADRTPDNRRGFQLGYNVMFFILALCTALTVVRVQWINRPTVLATYMSNNPVPDSSAFACSCALPDFLRSIDDAGSEIDPSPIKSCYQLSDVETATIILFSNSTVPEFLDLVYGGIRDIDEDEDSTARFNDIDGASLKPTYRILHDSYLVTNSLSELDLWKPDEKKMLDPLYEDFLKYFAGMETVDMEVTEILSSTLFSFPSYYMLMMVQFVCNKYSTCAPEVILSVVDNTGILRLNAPSSSRGQNSTAYVSNGWLTCGGYDGGQNWDPVRNYYRGRCMIYPTYPTMDSRVKRLLRFIRYCQEITHVGGYKNKTGVVTFISHMLQVNQSSVTEQEPTVMGYLDVPPSSPLWLKLADYYPGIRFDCVSTSECSIYSHLHAAWTEVCNATSVCLTYKTAADVGFSSVRMRCMDFDRYDYPSCVVLADMTGNGERKDELCNPEARCITLPARKVKWQVKTRTELNNMNLQVIENEIKTTSKKGVCRNTHRNVVRYHSQTLNQTVFLETNCSTAAGLCTLTGRYTLPDDEPGIDFPRVLNEKEVIDVASVPKPFVCYGPVRQKTSYWAITTAGVILSFIESLRTAAQLFYSFCIWWIGE